PWFETYVKTKYLKSWLPTETDFVDLDMSCSNKSANYITHQSWFTAREMISNMIPMPNRDQNSKMTCSQLPVSSLPVTTEDVELNLKKKENDLPNALLKVRLYPTTLQKQKLKLMFSAN